MPDSPAKKKWLKENAVLVSFRLFKKTDMDIIEYMDGKPTAETIREALRSQMRGNTVSFSVVESGVAFRICAAIGGKRFLSSAEYDTEADAIAAIPTMDK